MGRVSRVTEKCECNICADRNSTGQACPGEYFRCCGKGVPADEGGCHFFVNFWFIFSLSFILAVIAGLLI